jgi:hypothetical protein
MIVNDYSKELKALQHYERQKNRKQKAGNNKG